MPGLPGDQNQFRRMALALRVGLSPSDSLSRGPLLWRVEGRCPFPTAVFGMLTSSHKGDDRCPGCATTAFARPRSGPLEGNRSGG